MPFLVTCRRIASGKANLGLPIASEKGRRTSCAGGIFAGSLPDFLVQVVTT